MPVLSFLKILHPQPKALTLAVIVQCCLAFCSLPTLGSVGVSESYAHETGCQETNTEAETQTEANTKEVRTRPHEGARLARSSWKRFFPSRRSARSFEIWTGALAHRYQRLLPRRTQARSSIYPYPKSPSTSRKLPLII